MTNKFRRLFEEHGLMALRRQRAFAAQIGNSTWDYDRDAGTIKFGSVMTCPVQLLGLDSQAQNTWHWAWAIEDLPVDAAQLQAARQMKELGEREMIEELTASKLPRNRVPAQMLGAVAQAVTGSGAFYRGNVAEHGWLYLVDVPAPGAPTAPELVGVLGEGFTTYEFRNHREAVRSFVTQLGLPFTSDGPEMQITLPDGVTLLAHFDQRDRMVKLGSRAPV